MIIEIKTKRLIIKKPQISDKQKLMFELNNWEVVKWLANVPFPYSGKDADEWINSLTINNLQFNIFLRSNLIGGIGLKKNENLTYVLGYWLGKQYWGNGYATEACIELVDYAFKELKITKINAGHFTKNKSSAKVLEKLGFQEIGRDFIFSLSHKKKVPDIKLELEMKSKNLNRNK